ncbi:hypothetical protein GCM10007858_65140 [Bradyrhizobium liaoningense]|nr:hypothetical protein GCM10007858_65140 [Bradyrhizobium liaoningense]
MNAELLDLKAFITVAETGSFVRTAKALNLSQPARSADAFRSWKKASVRRCSNARRVTSISP